MMTDDLKRSRGDYLQRVLDIAREMPAHRCENIQEQYYALKSITHGLRTAIHGLNRLRDLYEYDDVSYELIGLSESLEDYHSIARTASIDTIRAIERVIASEMRQLEEPDGNPKAPATQP